MSAKEKHKRAWWPHSFRARVLLLFCGVLLLSQSVFFTLYNRFSMRNAQSIVISNLDSTLRISERLLNDRFDQLTNVVQILSSDFGFRSAVATGDRDTIFSMMENHSGRIDANVMCVFDTGGHLISSYPSAFAPALMQAFAPFFQLKDPESRIGSRLMTMVLLKDKLYQMVIVPVKAPQLVSYAAVGFAVTKRLVEDIKDMTGTEVSLVVRSGGTISPLVSTNISGQSADDLTRQIVPNENQQKFSPTYLGDGAYIVRTLPLYSLGQQEFYAVLQASLQKELAPFKRLRMNLILLAGSILILSLVVGTLFARQVTRPLLNLAETARKVSLQENYEIRAESIGNDDGEPDNELGVLVQSFNKMLMEISTRDRQLKKNYAELEEAKNAAESANQAKSQFLSNISHELRTPLNAVIGLSSIMTDQLHGPLGSSKYLEYSKDINASGSHLLDIINDIIDLSKITEGTLTLNYEKVNIAKTIDKCIALLSERAKQGGITISRSIPESLPVLRADRLRVTQILLNILTNAVKFTPEGGKVHIAASGVPEGEKVSHIVITIEDTGIGMRESDIEKAFQNFGQVDRGLNRKYEGTGLGLPLTKRLMELHQGSITIQSKPGEGTRVSLRFPVVHQDIS
ncbi:MAG: HAMP domain-containing protein [Pseudomonadota bacterium]|nr:HAMP domain-containing protein [Pseudomonadota bacterium]